MVLGMLLGLAMVLLLAGLGFHCLELFDGIFPREFPGLDGLGDLPFGLGELVIAAFAMVLGMLLLALAMIFALGLTLVATLASGGFPGILGLPASCESLDGSFESRIGILLGDFAFLDKPVELLLVFSKLHPAL